MSADLPFYVDSRDPAAKQRILQAALKLFSERGLEATSIRDIAAETGFTNPALYRHFASKDELAQHLFEVCHRHLWTTCQAALASARDFDAALNAYVGAWLDVADEHPEVLAFLSDSARVLWPKSAAAVRRRTMIGLARSLVEAAPTSRRRRRPLEQDLAAASLQGTLAEWLRMIQVGVVEGPPSRGKNDLVALFRKLLA